MDNGASSYRRFLDGDETGLNEIVEMYGDNLMYFINGLVKNIDMAEDLMEDTFMELVVHKHHFREESSFKTYLFKQSQINSFTSFIPMLKYSIELSLVLPKSYIVTGHIKEFDGI